MLDLLDTVQLSSMVDRWDWTLHGMGSFSVSSAWIFIDKKVLISDGEPTRWCNLIPIKVNIMAWKLSLNKLPTRMNLDARGIDVPSVLCPVCGEYSKTANHLFFACSFVSQVYILLARWWDLDVPRLNSYGQWSDWFSNIWMKRMQKQILQALFFCLRWHVWWHRNDCIFGVASPRKTIPKIYAGFCLMCACNIDGLNNIDSGLPLQILNSIIKAAIQLMALYLGSHKLFLF
ncbi:reverse transcriptase domain, Reverse transcriptase zinc-binding domain protein [Artemisia annua]|uniref:Reverse transcriptase domain, Reverse transcriptase zinc-binding domain protein n=1 Tax=Artemisia annua TaxID=35608 RepID=A0A2U1KM10_ARTAN|nr:reverse transcriptase domain, Reverse transcriptase zinc-binding domain protein [Artemisia annua]